MYTFNYVECTLDFVMYIKAVLITPKEQEFICIMVILFSTLAEWGDKQRCWRHFFCVLYLDNDTIYNLLNIIDIIYEKFVLISTPFARQNDELANFYTINIIHDILFK